jgi:hypothetical protein
MQSFRLKLFEIVKSFFSRTYQNSVRRTSPQSIVLAIALVRGPDALVVEAGELIARTGRVGAVIRLVRAVAAVVVSLSQTYS